MCYTEAHLIDRELNERVIIWPHPPPPYHRVFCHEDFYAFDPDSSPLVVNTITYGLRKKWFSLDRGMWIAHYHQEF